MAIRVFCDQADEVVEELCAAYVSSGFDTETLPPIVHLDHFEFCDSRREFDEGVGTEDPKRMRCKGDWSTLKDK